MNKFISCLIILFITFTDADSIAISEKEFIKQINKLASSGNIKSLKQTAKDFFKKYPNNNFIADVRLILAKNETDPNSAIKQYKILVKNYRYFKKRDEAQYKMCEILYFLSKWNELEQEAQKGIALFKKSNFFIKFKFFMVKTFIQLEQFEKAKRICLDITAHDHSYDNLSLSLMYLSYINKKTSGLSRSYLYSLVEIITGFKNSQRLPGALYLLGRYYESKREYKKAYSAYSDVILKFPKSPESLYAKRSLSGIKKYNPSKTKYIPDMESIESIDKIDIQPEIDIEETDETNFSYSISLGPFKNLNHARELKKLIKKDFQPIRVAKMRHGFLIYSGKFSNLDSAVASKIRLAEEYGINGKLVKMIKESEKLYIYEE